MYHVLSYSIAFLVFNLSSAPALLPAYALFILYVIECKLHEERIFILFIAIFPVSVAVPGIS